MFFFVYTVTHIDGARNVLDISHGIRSVISGCIGETQRVIRGREGDLEREARALQGKQGDITLVGKDPAL